MKTTVLNDFLRKRALARLRSLMRGYRSLRELGDLRRVAAVKETLTKTPVFPPSGSLEVFAGLSVEASEIAVRQYLLMRFVGIGLGGALLRSVGKCNAPIAYPLPSAWRKIVGEHGFEVAERASAFLWAYFVALHFARGIFVALKLAVADARHLLEPSKRELKRYVFFDTLDPGNLPSNSGIDEKNNIVSWYLRWPRRALGLDTVTHNVVSAGILKSEGTAVVPIPSPLLPFANFRLFGLFLAASVISIGKAFFRLLAGQWWYSMMLGETVKSIHLRVQDPALLAQDYLFHNSNWIYRPLWTYEAERQGARILFYFYSTNIEQFKQSGIYPEPSYGWQTMTWSKYLAWDEYQENFLRRALGDVAEVSVVGPIPFHSGVPVQADLPARSIAVFDVQPMRDTVYQPLGLEIEYYVPRNANKFLLDIQETTALADGFMVFKRKRHIGTGLHPSYQSTINWLSTTSNYLEIDPDTSARALVEKCQAVISIPFTSTALIGRQLGKPSVYYDPHGMCCKDDRAAHGIPILKGKAELKEWLSSLSI
jgi:polysaccharide biosynthesis PFTS motif protein